MRIAVIVLGLVLALAGCASQRDPSSACCPCQEAPRLDKELMLVLSSARSLHHQADLYLQQGQVDRAIEAVRAILALKLESRWPEAEEARLDATARLAKLLLGKGEEADALKLVDGAVAAHPRESFYLSNLHAVKGEILEVRSKRLDEEGDKPAAKESARQAITAFEASIQINKRLQLQQLQQGGKGQ